MRIRLATPTDAKVIAQIHVATWQGAYSGIMPESALSARTVATRQAEWETSLAAEGVVVFLAEGPDQGIVGFAASGPSRDRDATEETGEIYALYVLPDHWRTGAGYQLWRRALDRLAAAGYRSVTLWVLAANFRGRGFYEKVGMRRDPSAMQTHRVGGEDLEEVRYRTALPLRGRTIAAAAD